MKRTVKIAVFSILLCACNDYRNDYKNSCGGDKPLPFEPGTLCHPCGEEFVCAIEILPGIEGDEWLNYVACWEQVYNPPNGFHRSAYPEELVQLARSGIRPGDSCSIQEALGPCAEGIWGGCSPYSYSNFICAPNSYPLPEICDNIDNDCDGDIDEARGLGEPLETDHAAICRDCGDENGEACEAQCDEYVSMLSGSDHNPRNHCKEWCQSNDSLGACRAFWRIACSDMDGDGFCVNACGAPRCVGNPEDCDDNNPYFHPEADEVCDGVDNNCDGDIDSGPCEGECGPGTLFCQDELVAGCSTDPDGPDYLPSRALCSTCIYSSFPNGTIDPETGRCVSHNSCQQLNYDRLPSVVLSEIDASWTLCPGVEGCGNEIDDNDNGSIDEDCGAASQIPYDHFERWCSGRSQHEERENSLRHLLDWMEREICEPIETDPILTFILQRLGSHELCTRALFYWLYWLDTNQYAAEALCSENGGSGLVERGGWISEVFNNPCANSADRRYFTDLILKILANTDRDTMSLRIDLSPEQTCLYGNFDFEACPGPYELERFTDREVCIAEGGDYHCDEIRTVPEALAHHCVDAVWPIGTVHRILQFDRCGQPILTSSLEPPPNTEFCPYGCDEATDRCRPCAARTVRGIPVCEIYSPDGSLSHSYCGADNCGNSCGECEYDERCGWSGIRRVCEEAPLSCADWTIFDNGDWHPGTATTTISPISPETDEICLGELPTNRYIGAIDGIPGWSENTCYDLREYNREAIVADGEVVVTVGCSANPCYRMEEWDFLLSFCRYLN